jgi:major membrane immunogen (membrane-anchored lipoprotein)
MLTLMRSLSTLARRSLAVLAASGVLVMTSCSHDDGLGRRYPVSGKVTYNGNPLEKGVISFVSDDPKGVGATGAIVDGSYKMATGGEDDGARAGKYKVTITAKEDTTAKAKADFEKARSSLKNAAGTEGIGVIPREFVRKAEMEAKSLIPPGYGDVRSTNLTADVKEAATTIDFKLSDADAPPAPAATTTTKGRPGR